MQSSSKTNSPPNKLVIAVCSVLFLLCLIQILYFVGKREEIQRGIMGHTFVYEHEGFGGDFTISFNEEGVFNYYEGYLSSYIGRGPYDINNGIICIRDDSNRTFYFAYHDNYLSFMGDKSDHFLFVDVANGDRFYLQE